MCGRYARYTPARDSAELLDRPRVQGDLWASYNVGPSTQILTALHEPADNVLSLQEVQWGFIPSWAKDRKLAPINARAETAATKPLFRRAFERRRCLIAADLWYEWREIAGGKQPYAIQPARGGPFFFAGIWAKSKSLPADEGGHRKTAAILTAAAHEDIAWIHPRMPVVLTLQGARDWVEPHHDPQRAQEVLSQDTETSYQAWPVSQRVNSPKNDDAGLLEPVSVG